MASALPQYPFSAIVGQEEMKLGLMLNAVDPLIGGVLIMGHRGTGKSTAVRGLAELLPKIKFISGCAYRCDSDGSLCAECQRRADSGEQLKRETASVAVVDLPLGATEDLELALALGQTAIASFWDDVAGTFVDVAEEHGRGIATPRGLADNAVPSANSVGADVLLRLALLTGDDGLADRARSILRAVAPALDRSPSAFGRMLCAADRALGEPIDVVVAAGAGGDGRALRAAAARPYQPDLVIASVGDGDAHAAWPLFAGKTAREGRGTAYACRGTSCDAPTGDPEELERQVRSLNASR